MANSAFQRYPAPLPNAFYQYTSSSTWNKPAQSSFKGIWVYLQAAGGGGGSGILNSSTATGGGGGGGGSGMWIWLSTASLGSSENYIIGTGGSGGIAGSGTAGGDTSFGSLALAKGGNGGTVGSTSAGTVVGGNGGNLANCIPAYGPWSIIGGSGGVGHRTRNQATLGPGYDGMDGKAAAPGGGGGAGLQSGTHYAGYPGGGCWYLGSYTAGGAFGTSGGGNGTNGIDDVNLSLTHGIATPTIGIGTGGGAGGGNNSGNGGNGGNGGRGCGGGGGGAGSPTFLRGKGGDGGDGFILLVEIF